MSVEVGSSYLSAYQENLKTSFEKFLFEELHVNRDVKVLLAVSGGMDSIAMWHLFRNAGLKYAIAHCNFKLRREESDEDERFIQSFAEKDETVYTRSFDTKKYASERKLSIQMAARELRYAWFTELKSSKGFDYIATAHHLDDQVETFFIQLFRSKNVPGLRGMPVKTDDLIRPMMFAGRESIEAYVERNKIPYRHDKSNDSDLYLRNRIRNKLIPVLQKTSPDFKNSILELMGNMNQVADSFNKYVDRHQKLLFRHVNDEIRIDIQGLKKMEFPGIFLELSLRPFGFKKEVVDQLIHSLDSESGKSFFSPNHRIVKDRQDLILLPLELDEIEEIRMSKEELLVNANSIVKASRENASDDILKQASHQRAMFDYDLIDEEVTFRKWRDGDYFFPLGLGGRKKLSDFFIDRKFSLPEKERQWVMLSGNQICWIVGQAVDDRYKVGKNTKVVLILEQQ